MKEDRSSYRQIMKATSLFGGVQVFNIIIAIIRSKVIAVLLGPTGMGIAGLLTSTTGIIAAFTNFGLRTSAIKDIAAAQESQDESRTARVVTVFRRLVWGTGLMGAILTLLFSSYLSQLTFGNKDYTYAFIWLSITLLLNQLASGQNVLLQGMRKLQFLAKANMAGALTGLIISLPLYYYWGIDGIVPALVITSFSALIIAWYYARKITLNKVRVSIEETREEGKGMLRMGFMLSLSGLIAMGGAYIIRVFISNQGNLDDVGLYNAGFAIIFTYVGLVFSAMSTDYYPRLAGLAHDNVQANNLINQQAEIGVLILAPILTVFLVYINWVVIILYSTKFLEVTGLVHWAALGMYFKVASWAIAFILLAKGASRMFFWNELLFNSYMLSLNLLGYYWYGLAGLGVSFLVGYFLYLIQVFILATQQYQFTFTPAFNKIFAIQFALGLTCFLIIKLVPIPWAYLVGLPFIFSSVWYSFMELDKRMGLKKNLLGNLRK